MYCLFILFITFFLTFVEIAHAGISSPSHFIKIATGTGTQDVILGLHLDDVDADGTTPDISQYNNVCDLSGTADINSTTVKFGAKSLESVPINSGWLDITDNAIFDIGTDPFTIEFWFYPNAWTVQNQVFFDIRDTSNNQGITMYYNNSSSQVQTLHGTVTAIGGNPSTTGQWYHASINYNNSGTLSCYINGVSVSTATSHANISGIDTIRLGHSGTDTDNTGFDGFIDDFVFIKGTVTRSANFGTPTVAYDNSNIAANNVKLRYRHPYTNATIIEVSTIRKLDPTVISLMGSTTTVGTTTVFATTTATLLQTRQSGGGILSDSFLTYPSGSDYKDVIAGTETVEELVIQKLSKLKVKNYLWKNTSIDKDSIEKLAKDEYFLTNESNEYKIWESMNISNYTQNDNGSITINFTKMRKDFNIYYNVKKDIEWGSVTDKNIRISQTENKIKYGDDRNRTPNYGVLIDDPDCPEEILWKHANGNRGGIDLLKYCGFNLAVAKGQEQEIQSLKAIIGSLTAEITKIKNKIP